MDTPLDIPPNGRQDSRTTFTSSAKSVFRLLLSKGPATRPQLSTALGLSRPTMSASVAALQRMGLIEKIGEVNGALGRRAAVYRPAAAAGHVIAVDAGSTHIRLRASTLDRRLLHSHVYRLASGQRYLSAEISKAVAKEVEEIRALAEPAWGPLRAMGIALPARVVAKDADTAATGQNNLFLNFAPPAHVPLLIENNVNCAAVAESSEGVARGAPDFAYIQVGLKIGMGVVLRGQLLRGYNGAAGEVAHLPFPWGTDRRPASEELENYLGAEMLMQRVNRDWPAAGDAGPPPRDTAQLLTLAEQQHPAALEQVRRHAEDIGALVAACVSVLDPGLVVLGGGIGSNAIILPWVRETVARLCLPTRIETSALGLDATVLGIEKLTAEYASHLLLGDTPAPNTPLA